MIRRMEMDHENALFAASSFSETMMMEALEDSRNLKIGLLVALLLHTILLWIVLPGMNDRNVLKPEKEEPVRVWFMPPPKEEFKDLVLETHKRPIPVPDPDPTDVEPLVAVTPVTDRDMDSADDFIIPEETPPVLDELPEYTAGLIKPVYDMAKLQRSVVYPKIAVTAGLGGYVALQAVLKSDGTVGEITVIGGTAMKFGFPEAAVEAVKKLNFKPGMYNGHPVSVVMNLTIHFEVRH